MMNIKTITVFFFFIFSVFIYAQKIERIEQFESKYIKPRHVDILLPSDYDPAEKYDVLYMHDGQMLFDSTATWNKQEWCVDETMNKLLAEDKVNPFIVVSVWNIPELRYAEYFPQKAFEMMPKEVQDTIISVQFRSVPLADNYLKFLVEELKPHIDSTYSTFTTPDHTFIMGSSMGGLISLYALCEYPAVFGGAACLSMHTPMLSFSLFDKIDIEQDVASKFRAYLANNLPEANTRKIYIDYGDQDLDSYYRPYQVKIDNLLDSLGWKYPSWETMFFEGENHSEKAWAKRLQIPLVFLLRN